jgi:hypothetical protein
MSLTSMITEWFRQPANPQLVAWIDPAYVRPKVAATPLKADETYLRVTIAEMVLALSRDWFKDRQPMASSLATLKFGDQSLDLPSVAAADPKRYAPGASVLLNYRLLDLVPFRGGTIELEVALLSVPGRDLAANAIGALSNLAGLVAAPFASALQIASKVKESAEMLGASSQVHLAYHDKLTAQAGANQFRDSYVAIVRTDGARLPGTLVVDDGRLRLWSGDPNSAPGPLDLDYLLLRLEVLTNRDDLRAFSDLERLHTAAVTAAVKQDPEAKVAERAALLAILFHPDLINADRRTLAAELKADCAAYGDAHGAAPMAEPRSWADLVDALPRGTDHAPVKLAEFVDP